MSTGSTSLEPRGPALAKKTLIPKIDQKISGKTKFTLQNNKISNQIKQESKQEASPKVINSRPTVISQSKIASRATKSVDVPKNSIDEAPKKDIVNPVKQITYHRTRLSNSDNIKTTSPKATAVGRTQEKSMPNVRKKAPVPLVKTTKATRISSSAKQAVNSPTTPKKLEKVDIPPPTPEKELTRKQSSENIPVKMETLKKDKKRGNNIEVVPEMTPFKKTSVANSKKQSSLESMASRSSKSSKPVSVPSKPVTPKPRPISQGSQKVEKPRPPSGKSSVSSDVKNIPPAKNTNAPATSGKSSASSDDKNITPAKNTNAPAKKKSSEKVPPAAVPKKLKSMEKIEESNIPKKTNSSEKKLSSEKIRGVSQSGQRKSSMEKISESGKVRPVTTDLPQRKVTIEKPGPKAQNMESVPEYTKPRSPKTSFCGKVRNVTISQPDVSFFTKKLTKNISKDKISVKNLITSRIASSITIKTSAESIASVRRVKPSSTAQALTFDFYRRYKYVAFVGQVEEDTSSLQTHITLYQPPEKELLLYDAANCAATQAYMKICGLDFTVVRKSNAEQMSPSGNVPFIRCGSCIISEFEPISSFITSKTDAGPNKDPEDATMKAFMAMVSGMLENAERYVCWYDETTLTQHTNPRNGARYPFPLNYILNMKKKSEERRYLSAQGTSYKTLEQILRDVDTCLKHLSLRLGNSKVFFGKKYCEIDALVYGHLYALSNIKLPGPARRLEQIVKNHPNLLSFAKEMDEYLKLKKFEPDNLSDVYQWKNKDVEIPIPVTDYRKAEVVC